MFNDWALVWGKLVELKRFPLFVCLPSAALNSSVLHSQTSHLKMSRSTTRLEFSIFIIFLLSSKMCIVSNLTPQTFECEWDVKWCGKEQQSRQNDLKSGLNAQLPLAHARSVHLLPLSALPQPSQVDLLEHDMMLVVLLMKHYRSLRSCNLL